MNGISSKVAAGGLAGALSIILVWLASLFGLVIPDFVGQAFTVVISVLVGFLTPETRSIPLSEATIKQVVVANPDDEPFDSPVDIDIPESKEPTSL